MEADYKYPSIDHARYWDMALDCALMQMLKPELFKAWFNFTVSAFRHGGVYPQAEVLAFETRTPLPVVHRHFEALIAAGLIVQNEEGYAVPFSFRPASRTGPEARPQPSLRVLPGGVP